MSFAGHVYDMIRRNKENREMLEMRRDRYRDMQKKMSGDGKTSQMPDMSSAEWDRIGKELKRREDQDRRYAFRVKIIVVCAGMGILLLIWLLLR